MNRTDAVLFGLLVVLWGSAYSMMKTGFQYFPPVLYAALMFEASALLLVPVLIWRNTFWFPRSGMEWLQVVVGAVFLIAGYHAFVFLGQQYTQTVYASVVVSSSPIVTAFLAGAILPDRRFFPLEILGLLISFCGVLLLLLGRVPDHPIPISGIIGAGPVLIFLGVLLFDGGVVVLKFLGDGLPPTVFMIWTMLGGGLLLHGAGVFLAGERIGDITLNAQAVAIFSYFTLGPTLAGYLIYYDLIDRMDVVRLNVVSYFTPVCAAVIGYAWLNEIPRWSTVLGFFLVLSGFFVIRAVRSRPPDDPNPIDESNS